MTTDIASAILPLLDGRGNRLLALVGAGGKTSAMFGLAEACAHRGMRVCVSTTTRIYDPRAERDRRFDRVLIVPALARATDASLRHGESHNATRDLVALGPEGVAPGSITVLAAGSAGESGKLEGVHPSWFGILRRLFDITLVEADGARRLPIKAPSDSEPVLPPGTDVVLGLIGLDCLGRPMDERTVHRPERFTEATGCRPGETIRPRHLLRLAEAERGLFKDAPHGALRLLFFNKTDASSESDIARLAAEAQECASADIVFFSSLASRGAEISSVIGSVKSPNAFCAAVGQEVGE